MHRFSKFQHQSSFEYKFRLINQQNTYNSSNFSFFVVVVTCAFVIQAIFDDILIYNIMEEEKKKFLLSRIKREQALIISQFQKYKKNYHSHEISSEKTESFLQHISHTVLINNSLASNLYEYLDKPQMEAIFLRINTIFYDLIDKYRKSSNQITFLQSKRNVKEIRQICDICHDKIETNRIENIRRGLDEQSECRAAVIKKLIQDSQLQRTTPVFTEDQDRQFKRQLEKVFKNKELVLQTNIHESNVFLATVEEEIAQFMVSFRKDFAQWGGQQIEEQNQNWGKIMKSYINKKLTNSFNSKIPNWIKKMHELFVDKQPTKPKIYFMNKECQVGIPTQTEEKLTQQLEELNHSLIMKRQALKEKERELEYEKIRSKALKAELQSIQQYYVDKLYSNGKDEKTKEKMAQIQEILANDSIRTSFVNLRDHNQEKTQLNQRELEDRVKKNKKKFSKLPYQVMIQKSPKQLKQQKSSENLSFSHNISSNPIDVKSQKSNRNALSHKQSTPLLSSFEGSNSYIDQGSLKLKRKAYNRQKREEVQNDYEKEKKNQSISFLNERQRENSELKDEVKLICGEISKDLKIKKNSKKANIQRFNSISITEDSPIPQVHVHDQIKTPTALVLPATEVLVSLHQQTISSDTKKRATYIPQPLTSQINKMEFNQALNIIIQHSKCQQLVTQHVKIRLNKMIQNFFDNLERRNSKSICFQPVKMSKVVLSGNKQNQSIPLFKDLEFGSNGNLENNGSIINNKSIGNGGGRSLKKQQQQLDVILQRKNKSLHANALKLPTISIKNYTSNDIQDTSNVKETFSFFIDEANAKEFEQSFERYQERHVMKPTPSQLQEIQRMYSELQLLKQRNNSAYLQLCLFMRYPFTSSKQKSSTINFASGFTFPTFCNYFLKVLWVHRECSIQEGNFFCCHILKFQRKLLLNFPQRKNNKIKRADRFDFKH